MAALARPVRTASVSCRAALAAAVLLLVRCAEFPVRYERIDSDQSRTLDFVFVNLSDTSDTRGRLCEAAPGDSMLLVCYFAGVPTQTVSFDVSWNVYISPYGGDSAYDRGPLPHVVVDTTPPGFTDSTDVVAIRFRVPDSVLEISSSIDEAAIAVFGSQLPVPSGFPAGGKAELLGLVDWLARMDPSLRSADTLWDPLLQAYAGMGTQLFSAPIRIFVTVNGVNRIVTDVTVRYNRFLREYPGVHINRNPAISFLGVYKVKGSAVGLQPGDLGADDTTYCLFHAGPADPAVMGDNVVSVHDSADSFAIVIDKGYSYFVATDSGIYAGMDDRDLAAPLEFDIDNRTLVLKDDRPETYFQRWFYQLDAAEATDMDPDDLFIIANGMTVVTPMLPSLKPNITHLTLWTQLYDYLLGEWNRPYGSTLMESRLNFKYTQAYRDSLGW